MFVRCRRMYCKQFRDRGWLRSFGRVVATLVIWFPDSETFSRRRDPTTAPGSGDRVLGCALVASGFRVMARLAKQL